MVAVLSLLLAGCAVPQYASVFPSAVHPGEQREAFLAPDIKIELPVAEAQNWSKKQLLAFDYKGQQSQIFAEVDYQQGTAHISAMEPITATALVDIFDDGHRVHIERKTAAAAFVSPTQLLSDLFLTQFDVNNWSGVLPAGWGLVDRGGTRRLLDRDGKEVCVIHYADNCPERTPVRFVHHVFDYSIAIFDFDCPDAKEASGELDIAMRIKTD